MVRTYVSRARSISNCATRRYFYRLFGVFFSFAATSCPRLYGARYSPQICSIVRTWRCCFPIEDPSAPNIGSNASLRIAVSEVSAFSSPFFSSSFSSFHAHVDLGLGFHRCLDGSGGSLVRAESLAMMRPSAISVSILSAVFIGEIVAPRICCVLDTLRPADLCPRYFWLVAS